MFNSVVAYPRAWIVCYKKSTAARWRDPNFRFSTVEIRRGIIQVNVPPSGKIDARTHAWIARAVHKQRRTRYIHGYDGAGPHGGMLIKHAIHSMNGIPICPPKGGHSSVGQINDDCRFHGGLKQHVRKRSGEAFLKRAREMAARGQQFKMQKLKLDEVLDWIEEWLDTLTPTFLLKLCREYYPPLYGSADDRRKLEIRECLRRYNGPRSLPEKKVTPAMYLCNRCGQTYATKNYKGAKAHEDVSTQKCFMLLKTPFSPIPPYGRLNYRYEPVGRIVSFKRVSDGKKAIGLFHLKLETDGHYEILYKTNDMTRGLLRYRGDWRKLFQSPPKWIIKKPNDLA